jgi:Na+/melibiose symporter-like transporter
MSANPALAPDRVALRTKLFYGLGSVSEGTKNTAFNVFLLFYYNQVLGLSGALSGVAIFLALCVDAITDPLVGSISDNHHSRWGRRHPFMYAAALPMALCFFLLFNPPALGETGLFLWLCGFAVGVRTSMTLYSIPSNSMVPELTSSYDERTTLVSYRFLFGWMGGLTASLLGYLVFFAESASGADGRLDPSAYGGYALVCAGMIFVSILGCAGGTHRLIPQLKPPPERSALTWKRFSGEVRDVLGNHSYRNLIAGALFASVAGGFNDVVGLYVNTYFWEFTTEEIGLIVFCLSLSVVLAFTLTAPIARRYEKKRAVLWMAGIAILFGPLPIFLRLLELMPPNRDPLLLWLIIGHAVMLVTLVVSIGILIGSMLADVVDEGELETGRRQEGMFSSAIAFTTKAASGIGVLMAGIALDVIAFPKQAEAGAAAADKVFLLGVAVGPCMMVLFLLTLVFLSRYRITRSAHTEILERLAAGRAERDLHG